MGMVGRLRAKIRRQIADWRRKSEGVLDPTAPTLQSLAPGYSYELHGVYFTMLSAALRHEPHLHNIALAGTYGTGKSSILRETARVFSSKVVQVSLLSLGSDPEVPAGSPSVASTKTNRIQKEIVKQLLYQQSPGKTPESRFRRIGRAHWGRELAIAGVVTGIAIVAALAVGIDVVTRPLLGLTVVDRPHWLTVAVAVTTLGMLAGGFTLLVRSFGRGRIGIERVSAGPATISLSPRSVSFFDEYLDEIIYFFEVNRRAEIVIIEDLDRFDDPHIFESLRSLNGLLNSAKQLKGRDIRFVYAMRDSVFEKLDSKAIADLDDEARAELVRANRTKFFDLVIPVVPFITHRNAGDLMHHELLERGHDVSKDLVHLVARHLADMRLVHNILNEYEVFKHRLLDGPTPVPGLDHELLFAMVVYKNAHMGDFEKIRLGSSGLDDLWDVWRDIVSHESSVLRGANDALRARIAARLAETDYAFKLGTALRAKIDLLAKAPGTGLASAAIYFEGNEVALEKLQSTAFWRRVIETGQPIQVQVYSQYEQRSRPMNLSTAAVSELLDLPLNSRNFVASSDEVDLARIRSNESSLAFLKRHTWEEIARRPDLYARSNKGRARTFADWAAHKLPSRLAVDLVVNGYITEYFSLHVSAFYGGLIRPAAMMYVLKSIERGQPDELYSLNGEDVDAIIREQGATVLTERSMLNLGVMDRLLEKGDPGATTLVETLVAAGKDGAPFQELYLSEGHHKAAFVETLAPRDAGLLLLLATTNALDATERVSLVDVAMQATPTEGAFEISDAIARFLEVEYSQLPSLQSSATPEAQRHAVAQIARMGAVVDDITGLPEPAIEAFAANPAFVINAPNLRVLTRSDDVSVDALDSVAQPLLDHVVAHLREYLGLFADGDPRSHTVTSPTRLVELLNSCDAWDREQLDVLLKRAADECLISDLEQVEDSEVWPALMRWSKAELSWSNLVAYLGVFEIVDDDIAAALVRVDAIEVAAEANDEARASVAVAIANAESLDLTPDHRVKLIASVTEDPLDAVNLQPRSGTLIGDLLAAGLLLDDEDAFADRLMVDWPTFQSAVKGSKAFPTIMSSRTIASRHVAPLLAADEFADLHGPLIAMLQSIPDLPAEAYREAARRVIAGVVIGDYDLITLLRRGGANDAETIKMLDVSSEQLSDSQVRDVVRLMGGTWTKIADPGWNVHEVEEVDGLEAVLGRLHEAGSVSRYPLVEGIRRVSLHKPS